MTIAVHQLLPVFSSGDAIGGVVMRMRTLLRALGYRSEIYADLVDPRIRSEAHPATELPAAGLGADDALMYHLSIGSVVARRWEGTPARRLLFFHNITPPRFWRPVNQRVTLWLEQGLRDLQRLAPQAALVITPSTFNLDEALAAGAPAGMVVPVCNADRLGGEVAVPARPPEVLFVGRIVPNKRHEDLLFALAALRGTSCPDARLTLCGHAQDAETYLAGLRRLARDLGVEAAVDLRATRISDQELRARYRRASVFACASEHEGLCVPLLEAMTFRVPIVAYAGSAVPETVGDAALLLTTKDPLVWAAALDRAITDQALRAQLVAAGIRRLEDFSTPTLRSGLGEALVTAGLRPAS